MRSSTQSTLTLCFAIFPSFLRAQEYTCTGSCANCPSYTSEYGGPFVAQEFCVDGENCFGAYQCFLTYGAPNVLIDDTQGGSWSDWSEGENVADCCTPPSDGSCDFAPSGTGSGLTGLDLNGTVQSSTNTILNAQALEDTFCPPYCADCVEGKYHSTLNYGNTYYTCNIGCGNENESEPPQCIPPVPDTCTSAENPIKAGNCSVEILQYSPASKTQDWWAFNIYFYDALWMPIYMTGNVRIPMNGSIEINLSRLQSISLEGTFEIWAYNTTTELLGLVYNGKAWAAPDAAVKPGDYVDGRRNVTSQFECQ